MIYALRKLIAFVFLGGMFWFIYQDLDNLNKPWFMHALGLLTVAFAFFWLLIPMIVVHFRIRRRCAQNRERHAQWRAKIGDAPLQPHLRKNVHISLEADEKVYFHEKGTLYATRGSAVGYVSRRFRPSDVAFPCFHRACSRAQRVHFYITDRRLLFIGKDLFKSIPFAEMISCSDAPGGLVFNIVPKEADARIAFTVQNPLIVSDILNFVRKGAV